MMKQPAENTNATAEEIKNTEERKRPLQQHTLEDRERTEQIARRLATERGEPDSVARAEAEEVVRNLKNAEAKP